MKLAYVSPLRPQPTGVSDYSEELLPLLARSFDITLVTDEFTPTNLALADFGCIPLSDLRTLAPTFDHLVYHLGNSPLFASIYDASLETPGVIVLHDVVLHHLRAWQTIERGDVASYGDEVREAYGAEVAALARHNPVSINRFEYPLSERAIRAARGVIVHSESAAQFVRQCSPQTPVAHIPMGIAPMPRVSREEARVRLGLPPESFVIATFGEVHPHKRVTVALDAFAEFHKSCPDSLFVLVGSQSANYDVGTVIQDLRIQDWVRQVGFVPMDDYVNYIAASDVCLNLRYPSAGETSAALLRLLGAGKAVLVTRTAAYAELPDSVCIKLDPDAHEKQMLVEYLRLLATRPAVRQALGANAARYVAQHHTLEGAAAGYGRFLEEVKLKD